MVAARRAGVLALQGDVVEHRAALARLGLEARPVRAVRDLEGLTHLVLPGGESTTLDRLMRLFGLREQILARARAGELALLGTCAGAILLGREEGRPPTRLGLLDAVLARNAYGRQVDSFERSVELAGIPGGPFRCQFIRAPRVRRTGEGCEVLGRDGAEPILLRGPGCLAATFHPELVGDDRIHRLFLEIDPAPEADEPELAWTSSRSNA